MDPLKVYEDIDSETIEDTEEEKGDEKYIEHIDLINEETEEEDEEEEHPVSEVIILLRGELNKLKSAINKLENVVNVLSG